MSFLKYGKIIDRLYYLRLKLSYLTTRHLLNACIIFTILSEVSTRPAKLTLFRGSKRFQTNSKLCKAGVFLRKPGTYTCACITGLWGFYGEYCSKPVTIAGGDNYCFRLKHFKISHVVPFGNPEHPFEPTLNIFHGEFNSLKEFHTDSNQTNFNPMSSFLLITDEPWTLYGDTGTDKICLKPTVNGKRKFCMFSRRPSNKIHNLRKKWTSIARVSRGCNSTLVWRADSCADVLPPNDFTECSVDFHEPTDETDPPRVVAEVTTAMIAMDRNIEAPTTEKTRFKLFKGWPQIQTRSKPTSIPINKTLQGKSLAKLVQLQAEKDTRILIDLVPDAPKSTSEQNSVKADLEERDFEKTTIEPRQSTGNYNDKQDVFLDLPLSSGESTASLAPTVVSSEERWIRIKPKHRLSGTTPKVTSDLVSSEEMWIKIQPRQRSSTESSTSTTSQGPNEASSEERWVRIQPRKHASTMSSTPTTSRSPNEIASEERWVRIQPRRHQHASTMSSIPTSSQSPYEVSSEERWIRIQPRKHASTMSSTPTTSQSPNEVSSQKRWIQIQPRTQTITKIPLANSSKELESSSEERWVLIRGPTKRPSTNSRPTTSLTYQTVPTTPDYEVVEESCAGTGFKGISRGKVKEYWLNPENNVCARSINDAVFTDQLRRFTVKKFDKLFPARLRSLINVEQMLNYTKRIMQKTCGDQFVPSEFFEIAHQAIVMFMKEDFFYGVEGTLPDVFKRIIQTLQVCLDRVNPFVFEYDELDCGIKKINGWVILPGQHEKLEVPESHSYQKFEPLIEITWKMFLNAHSLCFSDFKVSNDHHHFAKVIMEVFSKTIYDKWIEPIDSFDLYSFILPNFHFLKETMENMDYCVAAVSKVSTCPVWLSRTGEQMDTISSSRRKKRSAMGPATTKGLDVWDGEGLCMLNFDDPEQIASKATCV